MVNLKHIISYEQLIRERDDLAFQIKQLELEYKSLKPSSDEQFALRTTLATIRMVFCDVQNEILEMFPASQ